MKVTAIIVAGGKGKRMGLSTPKLFIKIAKKPLLFYSLEAFEKSKFINNVVLVIAKDLLNKTKKLLKNKKYKKLKRIATGGAMRARSVYNGLCNVDKDSNIVLIHDVARPLVSQDLIKRCIDLANKGINCLAAVPVKATIKNIDLKNKYILYTPDRKKLWEAQTPQVFDKNILFKAYKKLGKKAFKFSDDASLAEACGGKVRVVLGDYKNIKITTREDIKIAEALIK